MRLRSRSSWLVASTAALLCAAPLDARAQLPSSLTFFGDSFTDGGNGDILAALFGIPDPTPTPPYAPGVVSNGPVWANYFAAALGRPGDAAPSLAGGRNFAIGTARTGATGAFGLPIGMQSQLGMYLTSGLAPDPTGLFVLFGGALDVFDAALLASPAARTGALATAAGNIAGQVATLYNLGGARNFLVPSLPNVGLTPRGAPQAALLGALSREFNTLLGGALAGLQPALPGSTIMGLRLDNLFTNILADAATGGTRYGLVNTTVPCFLGPPCDVSVFVDDLHPTTAAHALIAEAAVTRVVTGVDVSAVPEPTTIALVGGGLLALGALARRRRAA